MRQVIVHHARNSPRTAAGTSASCAGCSSSPAKRRSTSSTAALSETRCRLPLWQFPHSTPPANSPNVTRRSAAICRSALGAGRERRQMPEHPQCSQFKSQHEGSNGPAFAQVGERIPRPRRTAQGADRRRASVRGAVRRRSSPRTDLPDHGRGAGTIDRAWLQSTGRGRRTICGGRLFDTGPKGQGHVRRAPWAVWPPSPFRLSCRTRA